ncbi:Tim44/TimA family putative adaptor protein [Rhodovulum sp. DZ06]|uniref:Tim44/TimA family putative adaptor protein n=1 Tax=Rhodovulum sp. DZ06 TaxID=3425126 RepID=UPI003D3298A3
MMIELVLLAAIAIFVFAKLKNTLGTRTGFEDPTRIDPAAEKARGRPDFVVVDGGQKPSAEPEPVEDIPGVDADSAAALRRMAMAEPGFSPREFLGGARQAYEWILMAYENGDKKTLRPLLADDVYESFAAAIDARKAEGLTVEARFVGIKDARIFSAIFTEETGDADIEIRFTGELVSVVRNVNHEIVEGDPTEVRRQTDLWTFTRRMGSSDPNWILTATGG